MKKTGIRILSIVLAIALVVSLGITAVAAGTVTITDAPTSAMIPSQSKTLKADCSTCSDAITWESSSSTVATVNSSGLVTAKGKGTATITATCSNSECGASETENITVECCSVTSCNCATGCDGTECECTACTTPEITITGDSTVNLLKGGSKTFYANVAYETCSGLEANSGATITWSKTGSAVSLKDGSTARSCVVAAAEFGSAKITVTASIGGKTYTDEVDINVVPEKPTVTGAAINAILGTEIELNPKATSAEGTSSPSFEYTWYKTAGTTLGSSATFEPEITEPGTYTYKCDVVERVNSTDSEANTATFTVVVKDEYEVTIETSPEDATSVAKDRTLALTAKVVKNSVENNAFKTAAVSNPEISWTSENTSKLTVTANALTSSRATATGIALSTTPVEISATYVTGGKSYTDYYDLKVQNEFIVTLGATDASVFLGATSNLAQVSTVYDTTSGTYASNSTTTSGYYYTASYSSSDSTVAEVNSSTGVVTAKKVGTAKITVTVTVYSSYPASDSKIVAVITEECNISVTNDNFDICANLKSGSTINFTDANFSDWFKKQVGDSYMLNSVILYAPTSSVSNTGAFKYSGTSFSPNGIELYASGRSGSYFIANTSYTAGTGSYYVTVPFTCYGGTTSTSYTTSRAGTLYILVNPGTVGTITYEMGTAAYKTLAESDFLSVYRTASGTTSTYSTINIKLLDIPENGDLYYGYSSLGTGTKLTASNYSSILFGASNLTTITDSISDLTYIPDSGAAGADAVRYAVYVGDTLVYVARMVFDNGESDLVSYSEGRAFKKADFYASTDSDPVVSVKFSQPETGKGKIYTGYANGYGTLVTSSDSFNTGTSTTAKDVTLVTYIPPAGFEGNVTIKVTATTQRGQTKDVNFVITVKSKTASSVFTDVTAKNTGTWSANAIDYAYKWGLVNGTTTTAPLKYSPAGNMTRAQFVAILYRAAGSPSTAGITNPFTDIKKNTNTTWYYDAVLWAYTNKIVTGATATTYNPNGKLTREQLSKMLYGFDQVMTGVAPTGSTSIADYTDAAKVSSYAVDSIKWAVGNGIITSASTTAKTINPQGTATRAQVATMLHRYLTK